jgi:type III secretion system YscD/HrpQ family protein
MSGYLVAEEGALLGLVLRLDEGDSWTIGRDPDAAQFVLEDPTVSRKHVSLRLTPEGFVLENLSSVSPATQNGKVITEPVLLREGDILQIGDTFFRFTEKDPSREEGEIIPSLPPNAGEEPSFEITSLPETRWLLKVITGPNSGAELRVEEGASYLIGKDPTICDIVFQDLSVSREHARLSVDDQERVFIEDLGSRNGTLVNGDVVVGKRELHPQDTVSLGTTSFLVIDRQRMEETLLSPALQPSAETHMARSSTPPPAPLKAPFNWKEMVIPKRHLIFAGAIGFVIFIAFIGLISLFQTEEAPIHTKHEGEKIATVIGGYPDVQFAYTDGSGKLFLTGHVLTPIEKQELLYQLHSLPFLRDIEDSVVIDEYVWQNMNALLVTNPQWQGISIHSPTPGRFVMRGYLETLEQAQALSDYVNINFPYLDRLDNQIVIESNLMTEVESDLLEKGFNNVTYQLSNGELVLSGRVDGKEGKKFDTLMRKFKSMRGIRSLKNYVIYTTEESSLVDLTTQYKVTGFSRKDGDSQYVVVSGKILTLGDTLDGMTITTIQPTTILLEKDGLKFKIHYNLQ